ARLGLDLLARGLRLRRGELFALVRRAVLALARARVPAHVRAHPVAAAAALLEVLLAGLHGLAQRIVVALAADRALHLVGAVPGSSQHTTKKIAGGIEQAGGRAHHRSFVRG